MEGDSIVEMDWVAKNVIIKESLKEYKYLIDRLLLYIIFELGVLM